MNIIKHTVNDIFTINNYANYKNRVMSIPNLTAKEEFELASLFKKNGCVISAQKIIISQLKNVVRIAKEFSGYGLPEEDLVQEGNIGLMKAVKNFNPDKNVRLYSYAILWIKAEMQSFILSNFKIIKLSTTNSLKKLFFNFKKIQKELIDSGADKKNIIGLISKKLDINEVDVVAAAEYFSDNMIYLDYESDDNDNESNNSSIEIKTIETPETICIENIDTNKIKKIIMSGIESLPEREKEILMARYFSEKKITHKELAKKIDISSERIRQIEEKALSKIKNLLISVGIDKSITI